MPKIYAPVQMPVPKLRLQDLIAEKAPGEIAIGPKINWSAVPSLLSDLLTLLDPSGMIGGPVGLTYKDVGRTLEEAALRSQSSIDLLSKNLKVLPYYVSPSSMKRAPSVLKSEIWPSIEESRKLLETVPEEVLGPLQRFQIGSEPFFKKSLDPRMFQYTGMWFPAEEELIKMAPKNYPRIEISAWPELREMIEPKLSEIIAHELGHQATLDKMLKEPMMGSAARRLKHFGGGEKWKRWTEPLADAWATEQLAKANIEPSGYLFGELAERFPGAFEPSFVEQFLQSYSKPLSQESMIRSLLEIYQPHGFGREEQISKNLATLVNFLQR